MEILAKIVMVDDKFFLESSIGADLTGPLKFCDENDKTIVLTKNEANRWWANRKKVVEACERDGFYGLEYKESKKFGPATKRIPNEKLIGYLSDEEQQEYLAIIERAMKAKEEAAAKPLTDLEKAQLAARRAAEKYEKLLAQAAGEEVE